MRAESTGNGKSVSMGQRQEEDHGTNMQKVKKPYSLQHPDSEPSYSSASHNLILSGPSKCIFEYSADSMPVFIASIPLEIDRAFAWVTGHTVAKESYTWQGLNSGTLFPPSCIGLWNYSLVSDMANW